ncbi:PLP-dependent aminotransferase family protein [Clostridium sp. 19966]|uniref:MocR-like pyridoxine biosynthesis transcription factor PdxR n=1 Tax=Clostridium sp. 19966 TaxID=2768166 RepID=UPI0028DEFBDB|nr:PLP-dependent aminotransferase family protein [Clostridium sp. 19966]MDT8717460.1 PLP-dependent aminotransferase family protein [Clostridium sp. 19966]
MINKNFIKENDTPKYVQIYQYFKSRIDRGIIGDGEKMPTIRQLSLELDVNKVTIVNAYKRLEEEGYIIQKPGSGSFAQKKEGYKVIRKQYSDIFKKLPSEELKKYIDFTGESASNTLFPIDIFKKVLNDVLERDGVDALVYQDFLGYDGLRESIVNHFWNQKFNKDDILIVSGAQQGIDIISRSLINNNDVVVVEKPTYTGALSAFGWKKANIFEIEMQEDGIDIISLTELLKKNKVKFLYMMSYFQNPTSMSYSLEKKKVLLKLANKYDFYIIEDDYLSELIYDDRVKYKSLKSMDDKERVIYIKSFSKLFLPSIRLGYVIAPECYRETIQNAKISSEISTSSLMQRALELYLKNDYWLKHLNYINTTYSARYKCIIEKLNEYKGDLIEFNPPGGGLYIYIKICDYINIDTFELFKRCREEKVLITPGGMFHRSSKEGRRHFRIGFSQTEEESIDRGIDIILSIIKKHRK